MRREAGRRPVRGARPMWERTAGVGAHGWCGSARPVWERDPGHGPGRAGSLRPGGGLPATALRADPRELPPENGAEVPENESSDHTRLCGALRQGAKKSGPQSGGPEQLP